MTYDIFIVEDNPTKHEEIKAALPSSCIPTWTTAISQAFKILENKRWDLIILDMTFQVLSGSGNEIAKEPLAGIEVLQYLKRRRIEVPVIVATQHSSFTSNERPDIDSIDKLHAMLARLFSPNYRETVRVDLSEDTWKAGLRLAVVRALGGQLVEDSGSR
ncbi:response regulator [Caulobacter sp. UC70_42]|uniref:response regulator n=1 Tax=Caulobacter sp. UC70_42 TaxID=3374551 RepID=UPI003757BAAD